MKSDSKITSFLKPLVVVVGETGSGKSALGLRLALQFNGEIITSDARTVYRGLDIGTAKPTTSEQQQIPHHLLDILNPDQQITAASFKARAQKAIKSVHQKARLPIMVGGTGLYTDAVLFDYSFRPPGDIKLRKKLQRMSPDELQKEANKLNIDSDRVNAKNRRYLERLIETNGLEPDKSELRANTLIIGIKLPRTEMRARLQKRIGAMISQGLEREVVGLVDKYGWGAPGLNTIGYKEWRDHFEGNISKQAVRQAILKNSLNFAKRQRTWFKRNRRIEWVDSEEQAVQKVAQFIPKQPDLLQ